MTYKIGIRSGFGAAVEAAVSSLGAATEVEVVSEVTGIYRILMWKERGQAKTGGCSRYQSTSETALPVRVWQLNMTGSPGFYLFSVSLLPLRVISS